MSLGLDIESELPLISCVMPTYGRPAYVPEAVYCFLQQDYPNKELILLNDCPGQVYVGDLPGVKIVNSPTCYPTLGDKRNASIEMAKGEIIAVWDDDDLSLPWRLSHSWREIQRHDTPFYRPAEFLAYWGEETLHNNRSVPGWVSHGGVAFTKRLWELAGRYPSQGVGEDAVLFAVIGNLLDHEFPLQLIARSDRFYVLRGASQYQHMSIDGGRAPLDVKPGAYDIAPIEIQDERLRRSYLHHLDQHEIHSVEALAARIPEPFEPIFSVCVALKNRSRIEHEGRLLDNFPRMVRSLSDVALTLGPIQLVVADFNSTDRPLRDWLASAGNLEIKVVDVKGDFSRGRGLNVAESNSRCDRLFLIDADILIGRDAMERGIAALDRGVVRSPIYRHLDIEGQELDFEDFTKGSTFVLRDTMHACGGLPEF